ncbi:Hypothetical protein POVR1_LOCUS330 [uncultured virus]|nr:Hypothetical protein POVR1_LOCUS330 [uncultured virus]
MATLLTEIRVAQKVISDWSPTGIFLTSDAPLTSLSLPTGSVRVAQWREMKLLLSRIHWLVSVFHTSPDESVVIYQTDRPYLRLLKEMFPMINFSQATTSTQSVYRIYDLPLRDNEKKQIEGLPFVSAIYPYFPSVLEETYNGTIVLQPFNGVNEVDTQIIIDQSTLSKDRLILPSQWYFAALMYFNIAMRNDNDGSVIRVYRNPITGDLRSPSGFEPASSYDTSYLLHVIDAYLKYADREYMTSLPDDKYIKALSVIFWITDELRAEKSIPRVVQIKKVPISYHRFDPLTLVVNFITDKRKSYIPVEYPVVGPTVTWREFQNLMSEISFLNFINPKLKEVVRTRKEITMVVAGGYPGYHYLSLLTLYPFLKLEMWDRRFKDGSDLEEVIASRGARNIRLTINPTDLTIANAKTYSDRGVLFVSHVPVIADVRKHHEWFQNISAMVRAMKPFYAMIPFKLPYAPKGTTEQTSALTEHFKGIIFKQIFTNPEHSESMLIVDPSLEVVKYNDKIYEDIMAYYNIIQRDTIGASGIRYRNPLTDEIIPEDEQFNGSYDSVAVMSILHRYLDLAGDYTRQKIDPSNKQKTFDVVQKTIDLLIDNFRDVGQGKNLAESRKIAKLSGKEI